MKSILLILFVSLIALSGCASASSDIEAIDESDDFRISVLYEHTVLMIQYSTPEEIKSLGLQSEYMVDSEFLTKDEKVANLGLAYNTTNTEIVHLENIMVEMMEKWAEGLEEN